MKYTFTLLMLFFSINSFSQNNRDTLPCRALFSDPESSAMNKRVSVGKFYVVLENGTPVKFLMADRKRTTSMEIWEYRLTDEPRFPTKKKQQ